MISLCCKCFKTDKVETPEPEPLIQKELKLPLKKLGVDDFAIIKLLGKGAFAKVFLVQRKFDGQYFAMKVLKKKEVSARNEENNIFSERKILENSKSLFVVQLKYAFQNSRKLYMVMEFMPGGELFYHLSKQKRFNENIARFYISEVIIGLEYLHSQGIIYRDLKPENILLGLDGHIKLTDFGLSKIVSETNFKTRTLCGTPEYQAPEILMDYEYDKSVDFWSIGCLMFELISGAPPFQDRNRENLKIKILSDSVFYSGIFSESARNLIDKLLIKNVRDT
jgi:serine/threonine protein kinase